MSFKLTESHWNVLLEFMEQHKEFAKGQFSGPTGRIIQRKLWEELAQLLNSLGEGSKPVEKWQKIPSTSEDDFLSTSKDVSPRIVWKTQLSIYRYVASTSSIQTSKFKHKSIEASDHGYSKLPHPKKRKIQDVENELMQESLTELREIKLELRELNKSMSSIANSLVELVAKK
ncbi:unnamed protein product [Diabrotica balteata]|uniref:Regulatory protein zeste n=1 Tax=Diabrotica balteata TaxID=107213 RepID=A0A9N9T5U2_DIABA|nr:unnamed protein product [Diabrotica balteata]